MPLFIGNPREIDDLLAAYQWRDYKVIEGPVRVLRTQPAAGHAPGDLVAVSNILFEINFHASNPAYHNTIAHGSLLRDGAYARVFYLGQDILRIDLGNEQKHGRTPVGGDGKTAPQM
jgi:hypothetical protein